MRKRMIAFILMISSVLLSGCLFPEDQLAQNKVPYEEQIQSVQSAVNQFAKQNGGLLPIKNKDADTPLYQKYPIDFKKLVPQFMAEPPGNAFESGGIYQYVLIDVEKKPTVKLIDLRMAEQIREIHMRIQTQKYPPYQEEIAQNVYSLDFKKIGYDEDPYVVSPYTNHNLPIVITGDGNLFVDYSSDLYAALQKTGTKPEKGDDIRPLLAQDSMFAPAFSLPYTVDKNNEPVFMAN
ncbi:hypothetical protein [Bacillus xiapuensis]|uniref:hypothetical protein n=1 Tax=Bacillus xiapuensis TaxID=2014075 RepID=UPI000C24F902|nr:hypothetical protein [Bacillus xiapuensis]